MAVEEPPHTVVAKDGQFELRDYAPLVVAEVTVEGRRWEAANRGFRPLADYIFGANVPKEKIAMTAPVAQRRTGETIAMTAPVAQSEAGEGRWVVRFVMPAGQTLESLPEPANAAVRLVSEPARRFAAVRFSGLAGDETIARKEATLRDWIAARGLTPAGPPSYAYYDPPWTLPWLRRNEVMIPVESP